MPKIDSERKASSSTHLVEKREREQQHETESAYSNSYREQSRGWQTREYNMFNLCLTSMFYVDKYQLYARIIYE
jgi:hypothetical protein